MSHELAKRITLCVDSISLNPEAHCLRCTLKGCEVDWHSPCKLDTHCTRVLVFTATRLPTAEPTVRPWHAGGLARWRAGGTAGWWVRLPDYWPPCLWPPPVRLLRPLVFPGVCPSPTRPDASLLPLSDYPKDPAAQQRGGLRRRQLRRHEGRGRAGRGLARRGEGSPRGPGEGGRTAQHYRDAEESNPASLARQGRGATRVTKAARAAPASSSAMAGRPCGRRSPVSNAASTSVWVQPRKSRMATRHEFGSFNPSVP